MKSSAKATIISALERNESKKIKPNKKFKRCSPQKTDYPKTNFNPSFKFNCSVSMDENCQFLRISKLPLKESKQNQKKNSLQIQKKKKKIKEFKLLPIAAWINYKNYLANCFLSISFFFKKVCQFKNFSLLKKILANFLFLLFNFRTNNK